MRLLSAAALFSLWLFLLSFGCHILPIPGTQFAGFQVSWLGTNGETGAATTNDKNGNTTANVSTLTLSTVHGAGHEVPTYKGQQALQLFRRFLAR
jgi:hypothetical protein